MASPSSTTASHRQGTHEVGDLGDRVRHLVHAAGVEAHLVAALVCLDARAVHLPLEGHLAWQLRECVRHVDRGLRQHRRHGREQLESEGPQPRDPACEGCLRDRAEIGCIHRRSPHLARSDRGGRADRLRHDTRQCALAQLTDQQLHQEMLLRRRGAREQLLQGLGTPRARAGAPQVGERTQPAVEFPQCQGGFVGRVLSRALQGRIAQADAALRNLAREVVRGERDLGRFERPQQSREFADFRAAGTARADALRTGDQGGEERHGGQL